MYCAELEIKDTAESITSASYLDLLLSIGRDGQLHTSIYDKRDDFNFHITYFSFLSRNIHLRWHMTFLYLSLYDTPGLDTGTNVLFWGSGDFPVSCSNRDTSWNTWNRHSRSFMVYTGILLAIWILPLTNVMWHSDPWPTVTSQPIRLSTNFMTLIPRLTFTELWVVSKEHLQRVWHVSGESLAFRTLGSVPLFGTCLCSNCWNQIPRTCHVLTRLFTLNTPWYFLDFAWLPWDALLLLHITCAIQSPCIIHSLILPN